MARNRTLRNRRLTGAALLGAAFLASASPAWSAWSLDLGPLGYLSTAGARKGYEVTALLWWLLILSIVVVVIISAMVLIGVIARRSEEADVASQPIDPTRRGVGWIAVGTTVSTVALIGAMAWNGYTMAAINRPPVEPAVTIDIRGHQWWWEVSYRSDDPSRIFTTANEVHIPVGAPVRFRVTTADVIHSFWIPALGDKIDLIPDQENTTWVQAERAGVYQGQCAEFCGDNHAHMGFRVVAHNPDDFRKWWDEQLATKSQPASRAEQLFVVRCGGCHTVRGTMAGGRLGPDLTHLTQRQTLAAGTLPNNIGHLAGWIANPQTIKPGSYMPNPVITGPELHDIQKFLSSLD